ncbi:hypothetical protein PG985_002424 [Apiospora marii]|uniref:uncharacterized protein n=1 Tax=Apiospora marii TaxID=335849 RepID=UPI00313184AF
MLVVLAGLMLGRQRQRRRHHNTNSTEQPAWDEQPGASAPDRASWMGRRILGRGGCARQHSHITQPVTPSRGSPPPSSSREIIALAPKRNKKRACGPP